MCVCVCVQASCWLSCQHAAPHPRPLSSDRHAGRPRPAEGAQSGGGCAPSPACSHGAGQSACTPTRRYSLRPFLRSCQGRLCAHSHTMPFLIHLPNPSQAVQRQAWARIHLLMRDLLCASIRQDSPSSIGSVKSFVGAVHWPRCDLSALLGQTRGRALGSLF